MDIRRTSSAVLSPGDRRLLHDLHAVECMADSQRLPAVLRVEALLGPDFAHAVRTSLADVAPKAA